MTSQVQERRREHNRASEGPGFLFFLKHAFGFWQSTRSKEPPTDGAEWKMDIQPPAAVTLGIVNSQRSVGEERNPSISRAQKQGLTSVTAAVWKKVVHRPFCFRHRHWKIPPDVTTEETESALTTSCWREAQLCAGKMVGCSFPSGRKRKRGFAARGEGMTHSCWGRGRFNLSWSLGGELGFLHLMGQFISQFRIKLACLQVCSLNHFKLLLHHSLLPQSHSGAFLNESSHEFSQRTLILSLLSRDWRALLKNLGKKCNIGWICICFRVCSRTVFCLTFSFALSCLYIYGVKSVTKFTNAVVDLCVKESLHWYNFLILSIIKKQQN